MTTTDTDQIEARRVNVWLTPQLWWRVLIVVATLLAFLTGSRNLSYFTAQSNLLVLAYFAGASYWMIKRGTSDAPAPILRGSTTLAILVTGLVSHFVLKNGENPIPGLFVPDPGDALFNQGVFLLHYVVPVMVLLDWILFGPNRVLRWRDAAWWLVFPVGYALVYIVRGLVLPAVPDRFPYPFLDPFSNGLVGMLIQMPRVIAIIVVLGVVLFGLDRLAWQVKRNLRGED